MGCALWLAVFEPGAHATLAGFLIGLVVPLRVDGYKPSPLPAAENGLRPWVAVVIVPMIALFDSDISLLDTTTASLSTTVVLGTTLALLVGKPTRIVAIGWLSVRLNIAHLPQGARWPQLAGVSMLAGIGFTMSRFFAGVAFGTNDGLALSAEIGTVAGSLASTALGLAFLATITSRNTAPEEYRELG